MRGNSEIPPLLFRNSNLFSKIRTLTGGQFFWGGILPKGNGGVYKGWLSRNGNPGDSVKAQASFTARPTSQAVAKAEHSEPTVRIRCGRRLTDKSYSGDNRLVWSKSPYRRPGSAPRCRLILSWGWRRSQGFGCSPIKKVRELGSNRRETGWS